MCGLQAHHKIAHMQLQGNAGRLPGRPEQHAVTTGVASAARAAHGPPVVTGLPRDRLQQIGANVAAVLAGMPERANLLAQPILAQHVPKRPAPAPPAASGSGGQPGQLPSAQAAAAARFPSSAQWGSQHSVHALSHPSATAYVQLARASALGKDLGSRVSTAPGGSMALPQRLQQAGGPQARPGHALAVLRQAPKARPAPSAAVRQPTCTPTAGQPTSAAVPKSPPAPPAAEQQPPRSPPAAQPSSAAAPPVKAADGEPGMPCQLAHLVGCISFSIACA